MHIETLKIFCDLVQLRSFSKTAEKNLVSQSAVSQQLAQLELAHKCQLLDRTKRPLELTAAGEVFYEACKEMVERYDQLRSQLKTLQESSANRVNVAAIYSIGMHALPGYVKRFMVSNPEVNVHIEYLDAERIYELVLSGDVDVGLVAVPKRDRRLEVYDFQDEPLVFACNPKHPLAGEPEIDIHQVQFERFIAFGPDVPTGLWIAGILQRYDITVKPVMEFDNIETVKRAIEINSGVSVLPRSGMAQELASGTIKAVEFSNERFVRPTGIIVRKNRVLSKSARYFLELLCRKG